MINEQKKLVNKILKISGIVISLTSLTLAWLWFGWKLVLIIILGLWGNNLENKFK